MVDLNQQSHKESIPICIVADSNDQALKIFEELDLKHEFRLVPNEYGQKKNTITFFQAILLANSQPIPYEKSVPVQIKYR